MKYLFCHRQATGVPPPLSFCSQLGQFQSAANKNQFQSAANINNDMMGKVSKDMYDHALG